MYGIATFDTSSYTLLNLTSNPNTVLSAISNNVYAGASTTVYTNTDGGLRECYRVEPSGPSGILAPGRGWDGKMTRMVILVRCIFWMSHKGQLWASSYMMLATSCSAHTASSSYQPYYWADSCCSACTHVFIASSLRLMLKQHATCIAGCNH